MLSIQEQVEAQLRAAQANKKFKDSGERVSGSRKEKNAFKRVTLENLADLEDSDLGELVTKDRVFEEFNWKEQRELGVSAGAAWLKYRLRNSIKKQPINFEEARSYYVSYLTIFRKELEPLKTVLEIRGWMLKTMREIGTYIRFDPPKRYANAIIHKIEVKADVIGAGFFNLCELWTKTSKTAIENARLKNAVSDEQSQRMINNALSDWHSTTKKDLIFEYIDKINTINSIEELYSAFEVLITRRSDLEIYSAIINNGRLCISYEDDENGDLEGIKSKTLHVLKKYGLDNIEKGEAEIKANPFFQVRAEDWSWAKIKGDKTNDLDDNTPIVEIPKTAREMPLHYRNPLPFITRKGGREVLNVTVANIREKFCYKYVEFGNSMTDRESAYHVKNFIGAMYDLEEALEIDLCKINRLGGLSIAFGSRGTRGALATYSSAKRLINLTNKNGDGSIAHEWGHFLDNFIAKNVYEKSQILVNNSRGAFATETGASDLGLEFRVSELMNYITEGKKSVEIHRIERSKRYITKREGGTLIEKLNTFNRAFLLKDFKIYKEEIGAVSSSMKLNYIDVPFVASGTDFYSHSKAMKNNYWSKNVELFARAWECYVEDKLAQKGLVNSYLVNIPEDTELYPKGEERERLFRYFDELIDTIRYTYDLKTQPIPADVPRVNYKVQNDLTNEDSQVEDFAEPEPLKISTVELEQAYIENARKNPKQLKWMSEISNKFQAKYKVLPTFSMIENMTENAKADMDFWTKEWIAEFGDWKESEGGSEEINKATTPQTPYQIDYQNHLKKHGNSSGFDTTESLKKVGLDDLIPTVKRYGRRFLAIKPIDDLTADFEIFLDTDTCSRFIAANKKYYGILVSKNGFQYFEVDSNSGCRKQIMDYLNIEESEAKWITPLQPLAVQLEEVVTVMRGSLK